MGGAGLRTVTCDHASINVDCSQSEMAAVVVAGRCGLRNMVHVDMRGA